METECFLWGWDWILIYLDEVLALENQYCYIAARHAKFFQSNAIYIGSPVCGLRATGEPCNRTRNRREVERIVAGEV
jgi:hypothetical protein